QAGDGAGDEAAAALRAAVLGCRDDLPDRSRSCASLVDGAPRRAAADGLHHRPTGGAAGGAWRGRRAGAGDSRAHCDLRRRAAPAVCGWAGGGLGRRRMGARRLQLGATGGARPARSAGPAVRRAALRRRGDRVRQQPRHCAWRAAQRRAGGRGDSSGLRHGSKILYSLWWGSGGDAQRAPGRPQTPTLGEVWRGPGTLWVPPPNLPNCQVDRVRIEPCLRSSIMRKLIVNNFVTVDGYYEAKDKTIDSLFEYYHEDYAGDQNFDYYAAERLRAADTLILSGRTSFLGNKKYWTGVPDDANATPIRREIAQLYKRIDKIVVSDKITREELAPWENTRIVK